MPLSSWALQQARVFPGLLTRCNPSSNVLAPGPLLSLKHDGDGWGWGAGHFKNISAYSLARPRGGSPNVFLDVVQFLGNAIAGCGYDQLAVCAAAAPRRYRRYRDARRSPGGGVQEGVKRRRSSGGGKEEEEEELKRGDPPLIGGEVSLTGRGKKGEDRRM